MHPRIHHTGRAVALLSKRGLRHLFQWLLARGNECFQCRDCDRKIGPFESICPNCGAGNPARITISPVATLCGLSLTALIGLIYWL
jgi:hypothetical protein